MTPELEEQLYIDFPLLFANRENPQSPMVFGIECGDGWHGILRCACRRISFHEANAGRSDFRFSQVKEKWGILRIYHSGGDEFCTGVIAMAEAVSSVTCERCGAPGKTNESDWISTLCEGCRK
jgi:hypothetical protein